MSVISRRVHETTTWGRLAAAAGALLLLVLAPGAARAQGHVHPDKVGAERCGECHKKEFKAWDRSTHSVVLSDRDDPSVIEKSEEYAEKLGIFYIDEEDACASCHFTWFPDAEGEPQVTAVDCESCHGAARQWVDVHSDYGQAADGSAIDDPAQEDPAHRAMRIQKSDAAGMRRPGEIVDVTRNCLNCHTGPGEKIVNVAGHTPGSDFELVTWLSGEVRHNFHRTKQGANAELTPDRKRQLYVVGRALDLEYALRGLATAKSDGAYSRAMAERAQKAIGHLETIQARQSIDEVGVVLTAAKDLQLTANNTAPLVAAADSIQAAVQQFASQHDGSRLVALDSLIPKGAVATPFGG